MSQLAGEEEVESVRKAESRGKKTAGAAEITKGKQQGEASAKANDEAASTAVEQGETSQRRKADASEAAGGRQEAKPIIPKTNTGASQAAGGKQEKPTPKLVDAATSQPARSEQAESVREEDVGTSGTSRVGGSNPPGTAHDEGGDQEEQQRKKKKKKKQKK